MFYVWYLKFKSRLRNLTSMEIPLQTTNTNKNSVSVSIGTRLMLTGEDYFYGFYWEEIPIIKHYS